MARQSKNKTKVVVAFTSDVDKDAVAQWAKDAETKQYVIRISERLGPKNKLLALVHELAEIVATELQLPEEEAHDEAMRIENIAKELLQKWWKNE